jgi:primosomal protein N' (replication factor Y)
LESLVLRAWALPCGDLLTTLSTPSVDKRVNRIPPDLAAGATLIRVALPVALEREFDYLADSDQGINPGVWVEVKLGRRVHTGVVISMPAGSAVDAAKLRPISRVAREYAPLSARQLVLAKFLSDYYQAPLGMALALLQPPTPTNRREALVVAVRMTTKGIGPIIPSRARLQASLWASLADGAPHRLDELRTLGAGVLPLVRKWLSAGFLAAAGDDAGTQPAVVAGFELNPDQSRAADAIVESQGAFAPLVLHGVTGSGKTAVYLHAAARAIAAGGQVLMLVPEINLTPQLALHVRAHLAGVRLALLHSGLAASERHRQWNACVSGEAQLTIGTRLAVFTPLPRLALIIVDEEHDGSFKQHEGVRYHARDIALFRAQQEGLPIVLGSATPALETYHRARQGRYRLLSLPLRAAAANLPTIRCVPQREAGAEDGLTPDLLGAIGARLERREQSLLFINRRGYAPSLLCRACGWCAPCPRCAARLVVHLQMHRLACHHCALERPLPTRCPQCGNQDLLPMGFGTQRLEEVLRRHFPDARVLRIDRDSTRQRNAWIKMLAAIQSGEADILVGTQMLAKGHDFERLTLVGVLGADNALYSSDFRATERVFAQLLQVAGRAGRAQLAGEVVVQTDFPQHTVYQALRDHDYATLAMALLEERKRALLPPFSYLALLRAEAHNRSAVDAFFAAVQEFLRDALALAPAEAVRAYPPVAAAMARRAGFERSQMLFQASARKPLLGLLRALRAAIHAMPRASRVRWSFDVDPIQLD